MRLGPDEFKEGAEKRSLFPQSAKRRVAFILTGPITMVDVERLLLVRRTLWKNTTKSRCRRSEWDDVSRRKMVAVCGNQRWGGRKESHAPGENVLCGEAQFLKAAPEVSIQIDRVPRPWPKFETNLTSGQLQRAQPPANSQYSVNPSVLVGCPAGNRA